MIRLLIADDEARSAAIAPRLRGATIVESTDAAEAVAFLGAHGDRATVARLLQAGTHVLIAADLPRAELESLWKTARQGPAQLAVVNPDRYLPSRQLIKQQLPDKLGSVGFVRMHRWEPLSAAANLWQRDLDVALWLVGQSPDCVFALEQTDERGRYLQIHLGFAGGGMALIDYDNRLPPGDGYHSLSVIASSGAAYADDHQNMQLLYRGGRPQAIRTEEGIKQQVALIQSFVDGLAAGQDFTESMATRRAVFATADAVRESLATRQAVPRGTLP